MHGSDLCNHIRDYFSSLKINENFIKAINQ